MRQFIWIVSSSLYLQFLSVDAVKIESSFTGNSAQCVDPFGSSYNAGEDVPSVNHPCRQCVCGAKATILCESLNRITDCQPPDDAPCKMINGSTCCDRSFSCDHLISCSHDGMSYQPGESVRHEKEQCQDCKCGTGGKVRCEPSASCPKPAWIGELGGKDCIPLYSGDNCCPSDYLCKCVTFNETMSRGPRNVARCTTCSCSKGGGVVACEPVTCKIPYKFSDKCRPIYRGDDCCPIDYECAYSGKGKLFDNDPDKMRSGSFTSKPNTWDLSPQYAAQSAPRDGRSNSYDVLPYGQNIFDNNADVRSNKVLRSGPLGRSDEVPTVTSKPTSRSTTRTSTKYTIVRKTSQDEINSLDQTEAKIVTATGMNGTQAIMISVKDNATVTEPKVVVIIQEQKGSTPPRQPASGDPLLKLFLKVAEKKKDTNPGSGSGIVVVPTTQKAGQDETRLTSSDILSYGVSLPSSSQRPSSNPLLRGRLRSDQRQSKVPSGTAGVWRGTTTVSPTSSCATVVPQSNESASTTSSNAESSSTSVAEVAALVANETVEEPTAFHSDPETTTATSNSSEGSTIILSTGTSVLQTTGAGDVIVFADHPVTGTAETTTPSRQPPQPGRPNARRLSGTGTSRLNFESPTFAMSSADAGFLADDLSYKLFSVNFFRSPLTPGSMPPNSKPLARSMEALNPGNTSLVNGTDGQGQGSQLPLPNLTIDNTSLSMNNDTEPEPMSAAASWLSNVTLSPDFQVVTFGSLPRNSNRAKSAGQILPPPVPGLGGPMTGFLPFETEVEFKGFGMLPEIEIKPIFKGLAGAAGLAAMLGGGGGGGGAGGTGVLGGQLAGAPTNNHANNGAALAGRRMAAAAAAQDAMEELAEGGTGDGALALAATLMNPHRPVPARLMESVSIGRITTPPPTVSIVYPNGTLQVAGASQTATEGRSGRIMVLESGNIAATLNDIKTSTNKNRANPNHRIAEFNSFFGSPNHYRFHGPMNDPWSSSVYSGGTGAASAATGGATTTSATATKEPFPFETVADVIEEGRGPALSQLLGAFQMFNGGGPGGMGNHGGFGMMGPQNRGGMAGMNAMLNGMGGMGGMGNMGNMHRNFFPQMMFAPQMMGTGMDGGMGMMGNNRLLSTLGFLTALESNASPPQLGRIPVGVQKPMSAQAAGGRSAGPNNWNKQLLRPMYKLSSTLTESPLEGTENQKPLSM